ncbi:ribose 5-phosphate isomerase B [bacterium]|nr:ribose 5-phosphate isomerase B [bacterium]
MKSRGKIVHIKKLVAAADHGGIELKDELVERLRDAGYEVEDLGTHSSDSVDYPDYAKLAGQSILEGKADCGILVCGTGIGISIAANKIDGIYCAKLNNPIEGKMAAAHNHANMVALGGRITDPETAWESVKAWLETEPEGDRHNRRVDKIKDLEGKR